jgi:ubiquinone/menaquinone biosynthesis C-methylase UbiE
MFINPQSVIENIDIRPGINVADFGCGAGFYTLPIAKRIGAGGRVYAIDIRREVLEIIRSKARVEGILNVETMWRDLEAKEGSHLKEGSIDLVIISNILFQVESKEMLSREAFRILKSGGRVVLVEWAEDKKSLGPPLKHRVNRKEAEDLFLKAGFDFEKELEANSDHYGLVLKKP